MCSIRKSVLSDYIRIKLTRGIPTGFLPSSLPNGENANGDAERKTGDRRRWDRRDLQVPIRFQGAIIEMEEEGGKVVESHDHAGEGS